MSLLPAVLRSGVAMVAAGIGHTVVVTANGELCVWGNGTYGQLGLGDTETRWRPCRDSTPSAVTPGLHTKAGSSLTKVGSMSSVVSAIHDDDVLELIEGFAGFTFFNCTPSSLRSPDADELVAVESTAAMTTCAV